MHVCMCEMMSKGSKETLTVLIVTHVTYVERVKSGVGTFMIVFMQHCIQGKEEGYLKSLPYCGLAVHHQSV